MNNRIFGKILAAAIVAVFMYAIFSLVVAISAGASSGNPPTDYSINLEHGIGGGDCHASLAVGDTYQSVTDRFCLNAPESFLETVQEIITEAFTPVPTETFVDTPVPPTSTEKPPRNPEETPIPPATEIPSETPVPTDSPEIPTTVPPTEPTQEYTPTPPQEDPTKTPDPEPWTPTPKVPCNKGEGNGGENCDPGNNPDKGNNDED